MGWGFGEASGAYPAKPDLSTPPWTVTGVTIEINEVTAAGRGITTFFSYSRNGKFLKTKFDLAIYKRWRDVSSTSNFNSEQRDSPSIRTTVRYKVRIVTCLPLTRNSTDVVSESSGCSFGVMYNASCFREKKTGVQNVFQGGSFAVMEWTGWDNLCVSPAMKIIPSRRSVGAKTDLSGSYFQRLQTEGVCCTAY